MMRCWPSTLTRTRIDLPAGQDDGQAYLAGLKAAARRLHYGLGRTGSRLVCDWPVGGGEERGVSRDATEPDRAAALGSA